MSFLPVARLHSSGEKKESKRCRALPARVSGKEHAPLTRQRSADADDLGRLEAAFPAPSSPGVTSLGHHSGAPGHGTKERPDRTLQG